MDPDVAALVERLKKLSASVVSDVLDKCGYPQQSLSSAIRPLAPAMRVAGPVACFSGVTIAAGASAPAAPVLSSYEIDRRISPGMIVLIATNGHAVAAVVGGLMALSFSLRQCGGIVVDGGVRDVAEITELALPTFCRYATPLNSERRWQLTAADCRITVAGQSSSSVDVEPGDLVIGDADGVMVIPRAIAPRIIEWAEQLAAIEETIVVQLKSGQPREAVFAANPRFAHIGRLREP